MSFRLWKPSLFERDMFFALSVTLLYHHVFMIEEEFSWNSTALPHVKSVLLQNLKAHMHSLLTWNWTKLIVELVKSKHLSLLVNWEASYRICWFPGSLESAALHWIRCHHQEGFEGRMTFIVLPWFATWLFGHHLPMKARSCFWKRYQRFWFGRNTIIWWFRYWLHQWVIRFSRVVIIQ